MRQITVPVTAPFPLELEHRARLEAARQSISRAELVRRAVIDYLERATNPNPTQEAHHNERS